MTRGQDGEPSDSAGEIGSSKSRSHVPLRGSQVFSASRCRRGEPGNVDKVSYLQRTVDGPSSDALNNSGNNIMDCH